MARRPALSILLTACVIGAGWLLWPSEDPTHPGVAPSAQPSDTEAQPSLVAAGRPAPMEAEVAEGVDAAPPWLRGEPIEGLLRDKLVAWIQTDPRNLDILIAEILVRAVVDDAHEVFEAARNMFTMLRELTDRLEPMLEARLRATDTPVRHRAALLGAVYGLTWIGGGKQRDVGDLEQLLASPEAPLPIRALSASKLMWLTDRRPHLAEAFNTLLRDLAASPNFEMLFLLQKMTHLQTRARPFVATLLAIQPQLTKLPGSEELILQTIAQADTTNAAARELFARSLEHPSAAVQARARLALARHEGEDLVGALRSTSAAVRIEGVKWILGTSIGGPTVARDRLADLLLADLRAGDADVRDQVIALLPRLPPQHARALEAARELLASEDSARWIAGAKVLTALSARARPRDDVLALLIVAARRQHTGVRILAAQTLATFVPHARTVVPVLADLLRDKDPAVRRAAVDGLGTLSPHDSTAEVHLRAAKQDADPDVRDIAASWLK